MLKIRNFRLTDIDDEYISWLNDKKLMKFSRHKKQIFTKEKAKTFYKEIKKKKNFFFLVSLSNKYKEKKIGTLIGYRKKEKKTCNLGILISKQGKGLGLKAWKLALKKIFEKGLVSIEGGTLDLNKPMIKIFEKSGMKFLRKKRNVIFYNISKNN